MGLAVRGRLFVDGALRDGTLLVDDADGTIVEVAGPARADQAAAEGHDLLDVGDAWVLPSATDVHVHLREPGHEHKETIADGTAAAARGGVTAVYDMPNTDPPTDGVAALDDKAKRVARRAAVDVGLYAAPPPAGEAVDTRLLSRAAAVKLYMSETSHVGGVAFDRVPEVLAWARDAGRLVAVHAEDPEAFVADAAEHWRARPPEAEERAVQAVLDANAALDGGPARVHIAHATLASTLEAAASAECAPHHLLLDTSAFDGQGAYVKTNPPLRAPDHRKALRDAFLASRALLASDHAPHTVDEKEGPDPPSGVPGVETMVPLLLALAKAGEVPLARVVEAACSAPADLFGRDAGRLREDAEASFMVVEPDAVAPIRAEDLRTICGWTPFEGWAGLFPRDVYLRGAAVVETGEVVGPGRGQVLVPAGD